MFISDSTESFVILLYKPKNKRGIEGEKSKECKCIQKNAFASNFTVSNLVFITGS